MKKFILIAVVIALVYGYTQQQKISSTGFSPVASNPARVLQLAFENQQSNLQVQGEGIVIKILPDDRDGSRHQRFILRTSAGQTLLVAHNIDLAPRINEIKEGDVVEFFGEYEWNSKGGVIHWTHHDPARNHIDGWLKHNGRVYQ